MLILRGLVIVGLGLLGWYVMVRLVLVGLARWGAWARLIEAHGASEPPELRWRFRGGWVGGAQYQGTLLVGISDGGIFIGPQIGPQLGTGVTLPFDGLSLQRERHVWVWTVVLTTPGLDVPVKIRESLYRRLAEASLGRLPDVDSL